MSVLVIEDNDVDLELITRCLTNAELPNPLYFALDGEEALDQLRGRNGKEPIDTPCLILLDLNMPRMNGLEFLAELRNDSELADTPVLVLTTSDREEDIEQSHKLGVVEYVTKPISREHLAKIVVSFDARQHGSVVDERTYTVVVVDEEQAVRDQAVTSAMSTGWSVSTFDVAANSFDHVSVRRPDVIIVDKQIGLTSGVELLEQFSALPGLENTRMFVASESVLPADQAQRAHDLGASIVGKGVMADSTIFREFLEGRSA